MNRASSFRKPLIRAWAAMAVIAAATLAPAAGAGAAPTGSISGSVTDEVGNPLPDICVEVHPDNVSVQTGPDGSYTIGGLEPGDRTVHYRDCSPAPNYLEQWFRGATDQGSADPVAVIDGTETVIDPVQMMAGVSVLGRVSDDSDGPLTGISVSLFDDDGWVAGSSTDALGEYRTEPVPAGEYKVAFSDPSGNPVWATQFFDRRNTFGGADRLVLDPSIATEVTDVNAVMAPAASVSGTVTDGSGSPVEGICAVVFEASTSDFMSSARTDSAGTYRVVGLAAVPVLVQFQDCRSLGYSQEWYDDASDSSGAQTVALSPGSETTGIDAQLAIGSTISGRVTDGAGNPIEGIRVYFEPDGAGSFGSATTDVSGDYLSPPLDAGTYRVRFRDDSPIPEWVGEYWDDAPNWDDADLVDLSDGGQSVTDVDAVLDPGGSVAGRVEDAAGSALEGICIGAVPDGDDDPVGWTSTQPDGTYLLGGLPIVGLRIAFVDCGSADGPFAVQWFDGAADPGSATVITPMVGGVTGGIDATMEPAAAIAGRVTDPGGNPIRGVCVQASTENGFAGAEQTQSDGTYILVVPESGEYLLQFVDCNDTPTYGAKWWGGNADPATAEPLLVHAGNAVTGIDMVLEPAAPARLFGEVTNVRGEPMEGVCVVAFVPDRFVRFQPTDANGTYEFDPLPVATFAVGVIDCSAGGDGDVQPIVDPVTGAAYEGIWYDGAVLALEGDEAPDPIAQGAKLVTLAPGGSTEIDMCVGCQAVVVEDVDLAGDRVTASFSVPGLADETGGSASAAAAPSYVLSCTSSAGTLSSEPQAGTPVSLAGLAGGLEHDCAVVASVAGVVVARSAGFEVFVKGGGNTVDQPVGAPVTGQPVAAPGDGAGGTPAAPASPGGSSASPSRSAAPLAVTGADAGSVVVLALVSLLLGVLTLGAGALTSRPALLRPKRRER